MVKPKKTPLGDEGSGDELLAPEPLPVVGGFMETDSDIIRRLQKLLDDAPQRPDFLRLEDAVAFADRYDQWTRRVKLER